MSDDSLQTEEPTEMGTAADERVTSRAARVRSGTSLGRYTLIEPLGRGAMGSVFAAHDPMLDRRVAIKVLHPERRGARGTERLLREARALARLSHPNVVTINDVGRSGDLVYLAMELVDGDTLRAWLAEQRRGWREIVQVMAEAGRGLAAAHRAGLVHRDFKPSNVMLARDGRVLLADFGIALTATETQSVRASGTPELGPPELVESSTESLRLTRTGARLGTPRYMAPEQFLEADADPRTDQWAFCVVTWEALFGEHPVRGDTLGELTMAVAVGDYRPPPREHDVPAPIVRALQEGMAVEREQRHASMAVLLERLSRAQERRWRRWAVAAGLMAVVVVAVFAFGSLLVDDAPPCDADARMAAVWSEQRSDAVARAFDTTSLPLATTTKPIVLEGIDGYAQRWTDAHTRACEGRGAEPVPSTDRDKRFSCLNDRLDSMAHLVAMLEDVDDESLAHAAEAVLELPGVEPCLDPDDPSPDTMPWPDDQGLRERVERVSSRLDEAMALRSVGRFEEALSTAEEAHERAVETDYPPLHTKAALVLGLTQRFMPDEDDGRASLLRAFELATGLGMDYVAAQAALELNLHYVSTHDRTQSRRWIRHTEAVVARLSEGAGFECDIQLARLGMCREFDALSTDATQTRRRCEELRRRVIDVAAEYCGPQSVAVARAHAMLGSIDMIAGRYDAAIDHFEAARELMADSVGPQHPKVAEMMNLLQSAYRERGDIDRAHQVGEAIIPVLEAAYGRAHPKVLTAMEHQAIVLFSRGEADNSLRIFDRAIEGLTRIFGPEHPRVARSLSNRSIVLGALGRHAQAIGDLKRVLRIDELTYEPMHRNIAVTLDNLGHALVEGGQPDQAVPLHDRAVAIWELRTPGSPALAISLTDRGRALLASGRSEQAQESLERAIALFGGQPVDPAEVARAHFLLARALDSTEPGRPRAREHAMRARELYATAQGSGHASDLGALEAWLTEHP